MKTIPQELKKFKESLEGKVDSMNSSLNAMESKITNLINATDKAKSGIDSNYESENKAALLSSFGTLSGNLNQIVSSFGEMSNILNGVLEVITLVTELGDIIEELEVLEQELSKEESNQNSKPEEERSSSEINRLKGEITEKEATFDKVKADALTKLSELKSKDISINISTGSSASTSSLPGNAGLGEFIRKKFTASNGYTVEYLVYIPDYGESVDGLPINMYMHGSGSGENSFSRLQSSGLGMEIEKGNVLPSGIVILPLAPSGRTYDNEKFRDALAELPLQVADDYNGDKKRISLSGHSWGAITAYRLVNEHPGEFSAIVTASGSYPVTSSFVTTKVWAFHGSNDDKKEGNTGYSKALKAVDDINKLGGDAEIYTYENEGHSGAVLSDTFTKKFNKDGELINPLEWAFMQVSA